MFNDPILLETACGHNGNVNLLKKLIDIAKNAGAKQIKFQIFNLEERAQNNSKEYKIFSPLVLRDKEWNKTINYTKKKGLKVFADVYGDYSLDLANKNNVDGFKIHSEDFFNSYFIEKVINLNKPVLINCGGTYKSELYDLISFLSKKKKLNKKIVLMHGIQNFPTPIEGHSLYEFKKLVENYKIFDVSFGYSDHIESNNILSSILPMIAFSLGASIIEKHFTDDLKKKRIDHHSSMDQYQIKLFIKNFNAIKNNLEPRLNYLKNEKKYRNMFKKSCVINKNKKKNEILKIEDFKFIKDPKLVHHHFSHNLVGKKLLKNVNNNSNISNKFLDLKIGAIITVRTSSVRYPKKALKKINGVESISLLIRRIKKLKNIQEIILATSTDKSDSVLIKLAKKENIKFFRGSLDNVANRYYECAKKFNLDHIVRVTGDAIICDETMLDKAVISHLDKNADVTFIKNMPYGTAKEVISKKTLKIINQKSADKKATEYLEFFLENKKYFKVNYIKSNYRFNKNIRLTLDFPEDRLLFDKIYKHFKDQNSDFTLKDTLKLLKKKPNLIKINSFIKPKFLKSEINTSLKI